MAVVYILIGCIVGTLITSLVVRYRRTSGTLKIDRTDPEKDRYRFEIDDLGNVHTKKRIVLKIDPNANLSQE